MDPISLWPARLSAASTPLSLARKPTVRLGQPQFSLDETPPSGWSQPYFVLAPEVMRSLHAGAGHGVSRPSDERPRIGGSHEGSASR
jgi:hypothetical protein